MGVTGLQTYVETCPGVNVTVNLRKLAQDYIRKHRGQRPVLVVDGLGCLQKFYKPHLDWVHGGQWQEYIQEVKKFVEAFNNAQFKLIFIFDGSVGTSKRHVWVKRRKQDHKKVQKVFDFIKMNGKQPRRSNFTMPVSLGQHTRYILKELDQEVLNSHGEADYEIFEYCCRNNCFGVLAQDSDFIIYSMKATYLSINDLVIEPHGLRTTSCDREKLCEFLNIDTNHLPILASLIGNDILPAAKLRYFHEKLLGLKQEGKMGTKFKTDQLMPVLVNYLQRNLTDDFSGSVKTISENVFKSKASQELFQQSVFSYFLKAEETQPHRTLADGTFSNFTNFTTLPSPVRASSPVGSKKIKSKKTWEERGRELKELLHIKDETTLTSKDVGVVNVRDLFSMQQSPQSQTSQGIATSSEVSLPMKSHVSASQTFIPQTESKVANLTDLIVNELSQSCESMSLSSSSSDASFTNTAKGHMSQPIRTVKPNVHPEVLELARQRHKTCDNLSMIYTLLCGEEIDCGVSLEDDNNIEIRSSSLVYLPIRKKMFGLLLGVGVQDQAPKSKHFNPDLKHSPSHSKTSRKQASSSPHLPDDPYAVVSTLPVQNFQQRPTHVHANPFELLLSKTEQNQPKLQNFVCTQDDARVPTSEKAIAMTSSRSSRSIDPGQAELPAPPIRQNTQGHVTAESSSTTELVVGKNAVAEWCWYTDNPLEAADITEALPLELTGGTPSLHTLWLGKGPSVQQLRWEAFAACMCCKIPLTKLQSLDHTQVVLCCVLHFLLTQDPASMLYEKELDAFIAQAVSPMLKDHTKLKSLKVPSVDPRAVQLAVLFLRGLTLTLAVLGACGYPIPLSAGMPWRCFDGKLFHLKFIHARDGATLESLCDYYGSAIEEFEYLKTLIVTSTRMERKQPRW